MKGNVVGIAVLVILALMLISLIPSAHSTNASTDAEVTVIFQFGNQQVMSANIVLPQDNHTAIKATELAAQQLDLQLDYSWSSYGAYVYQIGWEENNWSGTGYYWHLMVWQNGSYEWQNSNVGASSLILHNGEVISWVYTADNPNWVPYEGSLAYPGHYNVWATPRGNINNTATGFYNVTASDLIWKFKGQSQWGFSSTPVFGDGRVFVADDNGLYALGINGELIWNNSKGAAGYYGIASPTLYGNYVIIGTLDRYVRAFYINNGTVAWETYIGEDITSAPVVDIVNKVPMVFVATFNLNSTGKLYALYLENGTIAWNLTLMGSNYFGIPAINGGKIIVPIAGIEDTNYNWEPPYGIECINENGTYAWNYTTSSSVRSTPAIESGRIYFVTTGGELISLSMNGSEIWSYPIGTSTSSPSIHNGIIYVGNYSGYLCAIEDEGASASLMWDVKLNGPVQAGVVYSSGKIIAVTNTNDGTLYVFNSTGYKILNYTPQPENYILSSPVIADSYVLVASNNGYLYAFGNNSTLPQINSVFHETAYVGQPIRVLVNTTQEYQAILYYKNVSGDEYHAVWMNYTNGEYVGYIPPQNTTGIVYYYVTLVDSNGNSRSSSVQTAQVNQEVPEFSYIPVLIIALVAILLIRNKVRG